jgi:hypothetical protein
MLWGKPRADDEEHGLIKNKSMHQHRGRAKSSKHAFRKGRQIGHLRRHFSFIPLVLVIGAALTWTTRPVWNSSIVGLGVQKGARNLTRSANSLIDEWTAFLHPGTSAPSTPTEGRTEVGAQEHAQRGYDFQKHESEFSMDESNVADSQPASNPFLDIGRHPSGTVPKIEITSENQSSGTEGIQNADVGEIKTQEVLKETLICELDVLDPEEGGEDPILLIPGRDLELSSADRKFIERERRRSQHPSSRFLNQPE